jgi:hypothetical protein
MTDQHPITPPPELVEEWKSTSLLQYSIRQLTYELHIATQAARWGADQELGACEMYLAQSPYPSWAKDLRAARRPKPPSLKEQALAELDAAVLRGDCIATSAATPLLRRALELVPEGPAVTPAAEDPRTGRLTMHVCPICGNKRCPKATDPTLTCTGSNDPGAFHTPEFYVDAIATELENAND